ncbi:protein-disulfide reductase DsbD family protein [Pseudomonadales bacterium]|nr:protein-disulfide reductase DsbD family protein [Pseudomonadales bacterium]
MNLDNLLHRTAHLSRLLVVSLWLSLAGPAAAQASDFTTSDGPNVNVSLVSEVTGIEAGKPFWVMLRQEIRPGWHTYWRNPGDSGAPTEITWDLPAGYSAGEIQWPFPERIAYGPLVNFGYNNLALYPVLITPPAEVSAGTATLTAKARWLVCADICIPENTTLTLTLPTGTDAGINMSAQAIFLAARQQVPAVIDLDARWASVGQQLVLQVPLGGDPKQVRKVDYFPFTDGVIENPAAQQLLLTDNNMTLTLTQGWDYSAASSLDGIIVVYENVGFDGAEDVVASAFEIRPASGPIAGSPPVAAGTSVWTAILFAFVGGLILNLMPCVFPVLSIKVLSLVQQVGGDETRIRAHGWVYLLGVVLSFTLIAGVLIGLRAGGAQIGWGFQLQSPWVIGLLVYLFFLIGLNLSGFFEIGTRMMGLGESLLQRQGYSGSFLTGVLATIVAAPCTAPFMASAIGFALTQSNLVALTIFAALGLGMAAPYLLLCYSPALLRALPRPGAWMARFKELLAFPMYASAIWLVWVLTQQAGSMGVLLILGGLLLLVFAIWLLRDLGGSLLRRRVLMVMALMLVALALSLPIQLQAPAAGDGSQDLASGPSQSYAGPVYGAYSDAKLASLRAGGPVFVNLTAAWCITCKVNEAVALNLDAVRLAFEAKGVQYLKGDWTNQDAEISRLLEAYGRSGVPLYLLYAGPTGEAQVLPQILTQGIVIDAINGLP